MLCYVMLCYVDSRVDKHDLSVDSILIVKLSFYGNVYFIGVSPHSTHGLFAISQEIINSVIHVTNNLVSVRFFLLRILRLVSAVPWIGHRPVAG